MTLWKGACHCGAVRFTVDWEIRELTTCDCSLCVIRNAVMAKIPEHALTVLEGRAHLALYEWNTKRAKHYFCRRCGIYVFHRKRAAPDHYGVNAFALEGFDPASLPVRPTEGANMTVEDPDARPEWPGPRSSLGGDVIVVMGVSGSGKSTVGALLAARLSLPFVDGDNLHPEANIVKMADGAALTDEDRAPWLARVTAQIKAWRTADRNGGGVIACSALKRAYREQLTDPGDPRVRFVYLAETPGSVRKRLEERTGHFMPPNLVESQFSALEPPGADEGVLISRPMRNAEARCEEILRALLLSTPK